VKLLAIKLRKHASIWWEHLKKQRELEKKSHIVMWAKMKALKKKYLPDHYQQDAFIKFHNFWQNELSVEEYTAEFDHSMMICDIVELEEQMVARYLGGLRSKIGNVVQLQPYWTYNDVCKLELKVKKQLKEGHKNTYRPFNQGGITNQGSSSTVKATPSSKIAAAKPAQSEPKPLVKSEAPSGSNRTNTSNSSRKCFKCHGFRHIASGCPNHKMISLVEEDLEDDVKDEPVVEESKEDLTYAIIHRILKSTYAKEDWLRNNIFHTKCTSSGKVCNVIINRRSYENVVSTTMVEKLNLKTKPHSILTSSNGFQKGNDIQITKKCLVQFSTGKNYIV
jgi:hypothetical protein